MGCRAAEPGRTSATAEDSDLLHRRVSLPLLLLVLIALGAYFSYLGWELTWTFGGGNQECALHAQVTKHGIWPWRVDYAVLSEWESHGFRSTGKAIVLRREDGAKVEVNRRDGMQVWVDEGRDIHPVRRPLSAEELMSLQGHGDIRAFLVEKGSVPQE